MMSATSIKDSVMSNITLALLGDTGWYRVDYSKAEEFKYGRNLGCSFLYQQCIVNSVSVFPNYFTTNLNNDGCWYDFTKRVIFFLIIYLIYLSIYYSQKIINSLIIYHYHET